VSVVATATPGRIDGTPWARVVPVVSTDVATENALKTEHALRADETS